MLLSCCCRRSFRIVLLYLVWLLIVLVLSIAIVVVRLVDVTVLFLRCSRVSSAPRLPLGPASMDLTRFTSLAHGPNGHPETGGALSRVIMVRKTEQRVFTSLQGSEVQSDLLPFHRADRGMALVLVLTARLAPSTDPQGGDADAGDGGDIPRQPHAAQGDHVPEEGRLHRR